MTSYVMEKTIIATKDNYTFTKTEDIDLESTSEWHAEQDFKDLIDDILSEKVSENITVKYIFDFVKLVQEPFEDTQRIYIKSVEKSL